MDLAIRRMRNTDPKFYPRLGPFLAKRHIAKELGAPIWDDDAREWFVAMEKRRFSVIGFAAMVVKAGVAHIASAWVSPDKRKMGALTEITRAQLAALPVEVTRVTVTATPASANVYGAAGFKKLSARGRYVAMEWRRA